MSPRRVRAVAAELTAKTGKLSSGMRRAEQIVAKSTRAMQRDISRVESRASRQAGGAATRGGRAGRLGGVAGSMGGMVKGAAVMGGIYGIQGEIKKAKQFEEVLVDIAVRGSKSKAWMDQLRGSMMQMSNEFGIGKEQMADYVGTIIDQTGNTQLATSTLRSMTAVAFSANVPMKELAGTVVEMQSKLSLAPKEFETALGILAAQADKGKVPLNQMSKFLPEVLNATTQFGHTGIGALRDYGAVLQVAARGAGSLAEANTAMNRMLDQVAAKRVKIEKVLGIKLKKNGAWLQLGPMLKQITFGLLRMKKSGKDVEGYITKTFGIRGKKAILPLLQQGMVGFGNKVGSKGGKGGLTSFDALVGAGGAGTIQDRVKRKRQLSPELDAWNKSVERLKNKLHMHLLPAIKKLGDIIPMVSSALEWMIDNWRMLLLVWGSGKAIKFISTLRTAMAGGGGMVGKIGGMLGTGGAAGGAAGGTATAGAATVGGGGLIGGLGSATAALGLFAISMAPAIAGLHELGKAYTKEGQKKKREQLRKRGLSLGYMVQKITEGEHARQRTALEKEGLLSGQGVKDESTREVRARGALGLGRSTSKKIMGAFGQAQKGKFHEASFQAQMIGTDKLKGLSGASDYQLMTAGVSREAVDALIKVATSTEGVLNSMERRFKDFDAYVKKQAQVKVVLVDPTKTSAGVTNNRRGTQ